MTADEDDPVRRLRGRLASPVTVWTAGGGAQATGLTMSSTSIVDGEPAHVLGTVGDLADLLDAIRVTERFVVHVLGAEHRALAERFAGQLPVPGGAFRGLAVAQTAHGPALTHVGTRVGCRLVDVSRRGYLLLVDGEVEEIELDELDDPLLHFRAGYRRLAPAARDWSPQAPDTALGEG